MIDRMPGAPEFPLASVTDLPKRATEDVLESGQPFSMDDLKPLIGCELGRVEALIKDVLMSRYPEVDSLASLAASMGGKRLRPALTLLAALATGKINDDSIRIATTVELVHAASLVHDDVLDGAVLRRNQAAIHAQHGIHQSILLGDFLFTRAYRTAAKCRTTFPARAIAQAATSLCEGELRQQSSAGNWRLIEADYLDIIRQKTGELCGVSCRLGAWSARASIETAYHLGQFGRKLGIAFQIVDDWLDIWGTAAVGKTLGTDLAQQKPTLPWIRLLSTLPETEKQLAIAQLSHSSEPTQLEALMAKINHSDAADYTFYRAERLVRSSLRHLQMLPETPARQWLSRLAICSLKRNR